MSLNVNVDSKGLASIIFIVIIVAILFALIPGLLIWIGSNAAGGLKAIIVGIIQGLTQ